MTKQIETLQTHTKEYTATIQLGATTPSYDMEHEVNETFPTKHITRELIDKTLPQFVGDIEQIPPTYSAVKVDGKRAFDYRRKGKNVTLKPKNIRIDEIEVLDFDTEKMQLSIRVVCSGGEEAVVAFIGSVVVLDEVTYVYFAFPDVTFEATCNIVFLCRLR